MTDILHRIMRIGPRDSPSVVVNSQYQAMWSPNEIIFIPISSFLLSLIIIRCESNSPSVVE